MTLSTTYGTNIRTAWVSTWGPIGARRLARLIDDGWTHVACLRTGLIRRDHLLSRESRSWLDVDPLL